MECATCGRKIRAGETVIEAGPWLFCRACTRERLVVESSDGDVRLYGDRPAPPPMMIDNDIVGPSK